MAGGNKQIYFTLKEDSSSPTVATKAVLLHCIIYAEEERYVAVIDIPNAFIQTQADNENEMEFINIRDVIVDLLLDIYPGFYRTF